MYLEPSRQITYGRSIPVRRIAGLACQGAGRRESAEHYFRLSLELDPLLWVNIQSLCELGVELDVDKHFEEAFFKGGAAATAAAAEKGPAAAAAKGGSHRQAGGPAAAAAIEGGGGEGGRQRRPPWAPYLALCGGNRGGASCRKGENTGERQLRFGDLLLQRLVRSTPED